MIRERSAGVEASLWRPSIVAVVRVANALFFLVAATYCLLTYSSFAYQQFIRPHLVASLSDFVVWHHLWHWVMLGATTITLLPELRCTRSRWARWLGWSYLAAMAAVGVAVLIRPVLPAVENDGLGLWLAIGFLLPPLWLAAYDHLATGWRVAPAPGEEGRLLSAAVTTAAAIWTAGVVAIPFRLAALGDLRLTPAAIGFGAMTSLVVHLALFVALALAQLLTLRFMRRVSPWAGGEYFGVVLVGWAGAFILVGRLVFASLSFHGGAAWLLAALVALALTACWSSLSLRLAAGRPSGETPIDIWFAPIAGASVRRYRWWLAGVVAILAFAAIERASTFDWDFLIQNLLVCAFWLVTAGLLHGSPRRARLRVHPVTLAMSAGVLLTTGAARGPIASGLTDRLTGQSFVPEFALDAYAAVEPSYRLIRHLLWVEPEGSAEFFATLRAHTLIEYTEVDPVAVDFVAPLAPAPIQPPNIFLFVVDSLRRDYLSPYNPAVTFTPAFGAFAATSDTFTRAFTRYGGTGLSMPAIWAGGMVLHKQYVLPFAPMNALDKLLEVNRYRRLLSLDHITGELLAADDGIEELDRGRKEMQYDLCTTLGELQTRLAAAGPSDRPVFAHTRSLNLHLSKVADRSQQSRHTATQFQRPAAMAIERMDSCFGAFIDFLEQRNLYDNSIVILTSDHGDSLGELKRWGHSYTIFPEVIRTPLIMHVPARLRGDLEVDRDAITLSTDITPTLYRLLGYRPRPLGWVYGRSAFTAPGEGGSERRTATYLVASSYGPVYGLLENNGQSLYVADGVNGRDYAYDLSALIPVRVGVTLERRQQSRRLIEERVRELARLYRFEPKP